MPGKDDDSGRVISIVNSEIDNLGGFLGEGPSQMVTNAALLIGSVAYMLIVEPMVALVGFAFLTPQIILCLLYTSPSPRDRTRSRMPSSA